MIRSVLDWTGLMLLSEYFLMFGWAMCVGHGGWDLGDMKCMNFWMIFVGGMG
jgi:hypothetical protein